MHNNIMAAGSRDRPPMLATGRYAQWRSRFLRYIDTRPNGDALRKCILTGPYTPTMVTTPAVPATEDSPEVPAKTSVETQQHNLDEVSYHKLFDILKQYQKEVNELRAERIAKNANLKHLCYCSNNEILIIKHKTTQNISPTSKASHPTRSPCSYKIQRQKRIPNNHNSIRVTSEEDSDPEQAQKDKDMQKNLALIAKYIKNIYKPTNNNLRTSSNTRNKNVDTNPRYKTDNQTGHLFGNQRAVNVVGARETVGGPVVQQSGIQCFNCKEFGHYAKECRKPN
ncbi:reverse transcriptase domain-containing protein [Tanacetum coccineum]|uniref:Reverse transcriptase domain-containing protein n=1 Tax=Tanacetum coccineum TaxID=301880 RepID=A0ABQ5CBK0_9ASTR